MCGLLSLNNLLHKPLHISPKNRHLSQEKIDVYFFHQICLYYCEQNHF